MRTYPHERQPTVSHTQAEAAPTPRAVTSWIIPANSRIHSHTEAFAKNGFVDWRQSYTGIEAEDIAYVYYGKPLSRIRFKCRVERVRMPFSEIRDDIESWSDRSEYERAKADEYVRLRLVEQVNTSALGLGKLREHGLTEAPQKPWRTSPELAGYIEEQLSRAPNQRQQQNNIPSGETLALATATTYDAVMRTGVTAHPVKAPYPKGGRRYVTPIAKDGVIEAVFEVTREVEDTVEEVLARTAGTSDGETIREYHKLRVDAYGGDIRKAYRTELTYRFYVMKRVATIVSPTRKRYVQTAAVMDLDEMELRPFASDDELSAHQIRIVPMDEASIGGQGYAEFFEKIVPTRGGRYYFSNKSLNAPVGSLLLFQLKGKLVACARLLDKNKEPVVNEWGMPQQGYYLLDSESVRVAEPPIDLEKFRRLVPPFANKRFSQAMHKIPVKYESAILEAFGAAETAGDDGAANVLELTSVVRKEGRPVEYYTTKYERSAANRTRAIAIHGTKCQICGFDFEKVYGELGRGFIEVHHIKPLHSLDDEVPVNPETDLVCLCSNCHRMVHRKKGKVLTVEELISLMNRADAQTLDD